MSTNGYLQLIVYIVVLLALAKPLGTYMARIFEGQPAVLNILGGPFERRLYRVCGVDSTKEMHWTQYALAMLAFNLLGALAIYALQRWQASLPFNPQGFAAVSPDSSFNTAASFATSAGSTSGSSPCTLMMCENSRNFFATSATRSVPLRCFGEVIATSAPNANAQSAMRMSSVATITVSATKPIRPPTQ
jgi:K+-transporting ATPase ATPase A chain